MTILTSKQIQDLDAVCQELAEEGKVRHVGVYQSIRTTLLQVDFERE